MNIDKWVLKKKAVPMALRLRCHMAVAKVMEGKYFIGGGIDSNEEKPSKAAYLYYPGTNKAIELPKMRTKKSRATAIAAGQFVYVFGGRNDHGDIIGECEKYSLEGEEWVQLPKMPSERMGAQAVLIKDKILLVGGCDSLQNVTNIDMYVCPDTALTLPPTPSGPASSRSPFRPKSRPPSMTPSVQMSGSSFTVTTTYWASTTVTTCP